MLFGSLFGRKLKFTVRTLWCRHGCVDTLCTIAHEWQICVLTLLSFQKQTRKMSERPLIFFFIEYSKGHSKNNNSGIGAAITISLHHFFMTLNLKRNLTRCDFQIRRDWAYSALFWDTARSNVFNFCSEVTFGVRQEMKLYFSKTSRKNSKNFGAAPIFRRSACTKLWLFSFSNWVLLKVASNQFVSTSH